MNVLTIDYILEELKEGRQVWDKSMLDILLPYNEDRTLHNTTTEELLYYLNNGYINIEVEKCFSYSDEYRFEEIVLEQYGDDLLLFAEKTFGQQGSYGLGIDYLVWNWLCQKGEGIYEPKRSILSFYAPALKISGRHFDCKPKYVLDRLKKGDNAFIVSLIIDKTVCLVTFNNTDSFREFCKGGKKKDQALKKEYLRQYDKKEIEKLHYRNFLPQDVGTKKDHIQEYDLVCWLDKEEDELKKGVVMSLLNPGEDAGEVMQEIPSTGFVHLRRKLLGPAKTSQPRCLVKVHQNNTEEYYTPSLSDLYVVLSEGEDHLYRLVNFFLETTKQGIEFQIVENGSGNWNAAYIPIEHRLEIHYLTMYNTILTSFINKNISPEEIVSITISHELGHADNRSRYNFADDFAEKVDSINQILKELHSVCGGSTWHNEAHKLSIEQLFGLKKDIENACVGLKEYSLMELRSEYEAWKYGREFVPNHLLSYYDKTNWESYEGYVKTNNQLLWSIHNYQSFVDGLIRFRFKKGMSKYDYYLKKSEEDRRQKFDTLKRKFSLDNYPDDYLFSPSEIKDIYNAYKELDRYDSGRMETQKIRYRIQKGKIQGSYERRGYETGYVAYKVGVIEFMKENGIEPFYEKGMNKS